MEKFLYKNKSYLNLLILFIGLAFISFVIYNLYNAPVIGIENKAIWLLKKYGYDK